MYVVHSRVYIYVQCTLYDLHIELHPCHTGNRLAISHFGVTPPAINLSDIAARFGL